MPPTSNPEKPPEALTVAAGLGLAALATVFTSVALFLILEGLFAARTPRLLAGIALIALGISLLFWVARRADDWRLAAAATAAACGFFYSFQGKVADGDLISQRAASASTALVLFIVAGVALGMHLLGPWREE